MHSASRIIPQLMILFHSLGGTAVECVIDKKSFTVFQPADKAKGDVVLLASPEDAPTHDRISWPGEYDIGGISIRGIGHDEGERVSYVIDNDGVRCAFISSPVHQWTDYEYELLGNIDVLCIPADDAEMVQKIVDEVDPRVLIPLPTKDEKMFAEVLKVNGAQAKGAEDEFKVKGSLPQEGREVVVLKSRK